MNATHRMTWGIQARNSSVGRWQWVKGRPDEVCFTRAEAEAEIARLKEQFPGTDYRIAAAKAVST